MTGLSTLKLVSSQPVRKSSLREIRRQKLCKKLLEQMEMARCIKDGGNYEVIVTKRVRDEETGESREVQQPKRIKPWWWTAEDGKTCLTIRYGAKPLELAKGRNAIETDSIDGVISTLGIIKSAVEAGELDAQIEGLASKDQGMNQPGRATLSLRKPQ